jgi:hypothetical protein
MSGIVEIVKPPPPSLARPDGAMWSAGEEDGTPTIYIEARAFADLCGQIGWGRVTHDNVAEQGGIPVGRLYRDLEADTLFGVASYVLAAKASHSSGVSLIMNHTSWLDLIDRLDALPKPEDGGSALRILGWYHTHPNGLDVFMSGTDRTTQRDFFSDPYAFALVLNPHRKIWKLFRGGDCIVCRAAVLGRANDVGG